MSASSKITRIAALAVSLLVGHVAYSHATPNVPPQARSQEPFLTHLNVRRDMPLASPGFIISGSKAPQIGLGLPWWPEVGKLACDVAFQPKIDRLSLALVGLSEPSKASHCSLWGDFSGYDASIRITGAANLAAERHRRTIRIRVYSDCGIGFYEITPPVDHPCELFRPLFDLLVPVLTTETPRHTLAQDAP